MVRLIKGDEFSDASSEGVVHHDAGDSYQQPYGSGFESKAQPDHDGADGDGLGSPHGMESQHNSEDGSQEPDVGSISRHRPDNDQPFGEGDFEELLIRVVGKINSSVKLPSLEGHGHGPHA